VGLVVGGGGGYGYTNSYAAVYAGYTTRIIMTQAWALGLKQGALEGRRQMKALTFCFAGLLCLGFCPPLVYP
jgi:uncharacterized membrane protein YccC